MTDHAHARELWNAAFAEDILWPDGRRSRLVVDEEGVLCLRPEEQAFACVIRITTLDEAGIVEHIVEQRIELLASEPIETALYARFVAGARLALEQWPSVGYSILPESLVFPELALDPAMSTAERIAHALLHTPTLAASVGPREIARFVKTEGLPAISDPRVAAQVWLLRHDDFDEALAAARWLAENAPAEAIPSVLATLESWVDFVDFPVWFTPDDDNAHVVLASAVGPLVAKSTIRGDRRRWVSLFEGGLVRNTDN